MVSALREHALARLVRLDRPVLQRLELATPWCARIDGCPHPGMYVVHRGAAHVAAAGERARLEEGDLVLLPHGGERHEVGDDHGTTPLDPEALAAREERRTEDFVSLGGPGPRTLLSAIPFDTAPLAWLPRVIVSRRSERDRVAQSLFVAYEEALEHGDREVVARVAEALWIRTIAERLPDIHRVDVDVLRAAAKVLESPARTHSLASLARAACLSRSRFSARFASTFGEPPMRWVQRVRMQHAERLLDEGTMSVAAIADALGFSDESAFRKAYRRVRGRPARSSSART